MKYEPSSLDKVIPVLSTDEGWMDNKLLILQQVFTNYLTTYHDQSNVYKDDLRSLNSALINSNLKGGVERLKDTIKDDLLHLYSKYFNLDDVEIDIITIRDDQNENSVDITIDVKITDRESNDVYVLSHQLHTEGGGKVAMVPFIKTNILHNNVIK